MGNDDLGVSLDGWLPTLWGWEAALWPHPLAPGVNQYLSWVWTCCIRALVFKSGLSSVGFYTFNIVPRDHFHSTLKSSIRHIWSSRHPRFQLMKLKETVIWNPAVCSSTSGLNSLSPVVLRSAWPTPSPDCSPCSPHDCLQSLNTSLLLPHGLCISAPSSKCPGSALSNKTCLGWWKCPVICTVLYGSHQPYVAIDYWKF